MKFGVHVELGPKTPDSARRIEELGFDYITCGERLMAGVETTNALVTLSAAAAVTSKVRLLTGIVQLPMYSPALLAKMATTVSWISGGRLDLGVGIGGEDPVEFRAAGVPLSERGQRANDALHVLRRLWHEPGPAADGCSELDGFELLPPPPVAPPIWVSGRSRAAIRRTAVFGDGWLPYLMTPKQLAEARRDLEAESRNAGRSAGDITSGLATLVSVAEDPELARSTGLDHVATAWGRDFSVGNREQYLLMGTPEQVADRLLAYEAVGTTFVTMTIMGPDHARQLQMLGERVLPLVRT